MTLSGDYSAATGLTDKELENLRKELSDNISDLPAVKLGAQDINLDKAAKKVSLNSVSTPWAWIRASVSLGFRF